MFIGRFVAELSNGRQVVERFPNESKDESGRTLHMGWNQLKEFCGKYDLKIVKMCIRFPDFSHRAPNGAEAYFVNMQQQTTQGVKADFYRGLGFKKDKRWFIVWINSIGVIEDMEVRDG